MKERDKNFQSDDNVDSFSVNGDGPPSTRTEIAEENVSNSKGDVSSHGKDPHQKKQNMPLDFS